MNRKMIGSAGGMRVWYAGVATLLVLALGALAWAGGDPWKTKPFDQWNENDIRQILHDSPWAKIQYAPMEWKADQGAGKSEMSRAPEGTMSAARGPAGGATNVGQQAMGTPEGQAAFYLRWNSSRTVREALIRDAVLSKQMTEEEATKYLSAPITNYEVVVLGPDMSPFGSVSEDQLKASSYLQGKQSKVKVSATSVQIDRSADGRSVTAVMFSFPRKTVDGKDVAAAQEKGLQFSCRLRELDLQQTFDLRKMADQKGPDF
ncbi:MAG TPA: hypothetical protein VJN90_13425 [Candidatus Acidoferrales bacterium]|nr:hypothetical protein [Candidatus Acidoferrales bacterium]